MKNKRSISPAQARYYARFRTYPVRDSVAQSNFTFNRQWLNKASAFFAVFALLLSTISPTLVTAADEGTPLVETGISGLQVQIIKVWQDAQGNQIAAPDVQNKEDLTITAKNHDVDPVGPLVTCTYSGDTLGCDNVLTIQQDGYEIDVTEPNLPSGWVNYSGVGNDQTPICTQGENASCTHTVINRQIPVNPTPTIVNINKVWQDSNGQPVAAPDNKSDIKITVTFGEAENSVCTYNDNTLVCDKTIYSQTGGTVNIVETGLPTGWEVDNSTVGVVTPVCPTVQVDNIVVGDQYPICNATVINKLKIAAPCNTQLVINGGFEAPVVTTGDQWDIFPSGTPNLAWSAKWVRNSGGPAIANAELHKGVNGWNPHGGSQHTELDSDFGGPTSSQSGEDASVQLFQDLPTKVGHEYTVSFWTSPRPGQGASENVIKAEMGGTELETITEDGSANGNTVWTEHTYTFTATSTLSRLSFTDMGTGNSLGGFLDDVSVKEKCASDVTVCKYDTNQTPLSGWDVYLKGDVVDTVTVNTNNGNNVLSISLPAGDYELKAKGQYMYRVEDTQMYSDAAFSERLPGDSVWSGPYVPWVREMDFTTIDPSLVTLGTTNYGDPNFYKGILGIKVDDMPYDWGNVYNPSHEYTGSYVLGADGQIKFKMTDDLYSDNTGSMSVEISPIYKGTTGRDGCKTFYNIPLGTYTLGEIMQDGWENVSGNGTTVVVDEPTETFSLVNQCTTEGCNQTVPKLHLIKVVCDQYSDVAGNEDADNVDHTGGKYSLFKNYNNGEFIIDYLVNGYVDPSEIPQESGCSRANGWQFLLSTDQAQESNTQTVTTVDGEYVTPVSGAGSDLSVALQQGIRGQNDNQFWVSEVEQEGYDFATIRCYNDVLNGDNLEYINIGQSNPADIYCIAYNVNDEIQPPCVEQDPSIASGIETDFIGLTETDPSTTSGLNNASSYPSGTPGAAVAAGPTGYPGAWDGPQNDSNITEGSGIWVSNDSVQPTNPPGSNPGQNGAVDTWRLYAHTFNIPAGATSLSPAVLYFSADNEVTAYLDGVQIGFNNSFAVTASSPLALTTGVHTLSFAVKNWAFEAENNPTGLIYNLDFTYCGEPTSQGRHTLTAHITTANGDGSGKVTTDIGGIDCLKAAQPEACFASYPDGTVVTVTAIADPGSNFTGSWVAPFVGTCIGTTTPCTVTINADEDITAHFSLDSGGGGGGGGGGSGGGGGGTGTGGGTTPQGQVLGDSTNVPSTPPGLVLGATTELPRTGSSPLSLVIVFLASLAIVSVFRKPLTA